MKLLILSLLLFLSYTGSAQFVVKSIDIQTGATLMDWDGLYRSEGKKFIRRWGSFVGGTVKASWWPEVQGFTRLSVNYRTTETEHKWNRERIKLDELAMSLGIGTPWKRVTFGLNISYVHILEKKKIDNTPLNGMDLSKVEDFYLTYSGSEIHHTFGFQRGERFRTPRYPSWALLGLSYTISQKR